VDGHIAESLAEQVHRRDDAQRPWNRYHFREYSARELDSPATVA
jgi:hypothetical protein